MNSLTSMVQHLQALAMQCLRILANIGQRLRSRLLDKLTLVGCVPGKRLRVRHQHEAFSF